MPEHIRIEGVEPPAEGKAIRTTAGTTPVAVFNVGGNYYAIDARCTHEGGPLDRGHITGLTVKCSWHGSVFRLDTGAVEHGPAKEPEKAYHVKFESGALILTPIA